MGARRKRSASSSRTAANGTNRGRSIWGHTVSLDCPQMERPLLRLYANLETLSRAAADEFVRQARARSRAGHWFSVALAGGATPHRLYQLLASPAYRARIPWKVVHLFWTDERCVPPSHPQSNFRLVRDVLLSKVLIPAGNIHRIPVECGTPKIVSAAYEKQIRDFFRWRKNAWPKFDLILLGLGEDGHTASLFPGSSALKETKRLAAVARGGKPNLARVTLTVPVLNHAREILWLVAGKKKKAVLRAVLRGGKRAAKNLPAHKIRPSHGTAVWFVDHAAQGGQ